jgi:hypothetical protein
VSTASGPGQAEQKEQGQWLGDGGGGAVAGVLREPEVGVEDLIVGGILELEVHVHLLGRNDAS